MANLKIYQLNSGLPTGPTDVLPVTQISSGDAQKVQLKDVVFYSNSGSANTLLGLNSGATANEYKSLSSGIGVGVISSGSNFDFNFNNASGLITSGTLGDASVNSGNISSGAINSFNLSSGCVVSGLIGNNAVVSGSIASGSISQNKMSSGNLLSLGWSNVAALGYSTTPGLRIANSGNYGIYLGTDVYQDALGQYNYAIGDIAGSYTKGSQNIYIGDSAGLFLNCSGQNTTATNNLIVGHYASANGGLASGLSSGLLNNVVVGNFAATNLANGRNNIILGHSAGTWLRYGFFNYLIGASFGGANARSGSFNISLGNTPIGANDLMQNMYLGFTSPNLASGLSNSGTTVSTTIFGQTKIPMGLEVRAISSGGIASGALLASISSGGEIFGTLASGLVVSGSIASGQIGINHLESGLIAFNTQPTTSGLNFVPFVRNISGTQQALVASGLMYSVESGTLQVNQSFLNNLNGEVQNQNFGYQNAPSLRSGAFQAAVQTFGFQCFLGANGFNQSQGFGSILFPTLSSGTNIQAMGYNLGSQATNLRDSSVIGANTLGQLLSGQDLVVVGTDSANNASGGANLQTLRHAVILGNNITTATTDETNVVIIGQSGRSQGSNTTVIGNSATTSGAIFGNINFPAGMNVGSGSARITASGWFEGLVGSGAVGSGSLASGFAMFSVLASGGTSYIATNDPFRASGSNTSVLIGDDVIASGNGFVNRSVIIGFEAGKRVASGTTQFTAIGRGAAFGPATPAIFSNVTAIGAEAMGLATSGATNATCVGVTAGQYTAGQNNTYIGVGAGKGAASNPNNNNVAVGFNAHTAITTGANCVVIGVNAGLSLTGGSNHVFVGRDAGAFVTGSSGNTFVGWEAGKYEITSGQLNVRSNVTCLGQGTGIGADNQCQIGNNLTTTYVYGSVQNRSDARDKTDIDSISYGLNFIEKLRPVEYKWNYRDAYWETQQTSSGEIRVFDQEGYENKTKKRNRKHIGLIAQEVKAVADEIGIDFAGLQYWRHSDETAADVYTIGYEEFVGVLIKSIQELSARVKALEGNS